MYTKLVMTCVICCEPMPEDERERLVWPTCNHVFHKVCAMNACQYSIKCPLCRHEDTTFTARQITLLDVLREYDSSIPDNVNHVIIQTEPHENNETASFLDLNHRLQESLDSYENSMRNRRNYMTKRRKIIKSDKQLTILNEVIKKDERFMKEITKDLSNTWSDFMKREWKNNKDICIKKKEYIYRRDKLARHKRELKKKIESQIGPVPELI